MMDDKEYKNRLRDILSPSELDPDINLDPKEGMRVFKKTEKSDPGPFVANTVVEFPIDPRVWLAGMAMQSLISNQKAMESVFQTVEGYDGRGRPKDTDLISKEVADKVAFRAELFADALLERLNKSK